MVGIDIIEIERIENAVKKWGSRFVGRIYTEREREFCEQRKVPYPAFAGRFAAKEASVKALKSGKPVGWKDIEILSDDRGRPHVELHGAARVALGKRTMNISISHSDSHAVAVAIVEQSE